MIMSFDINQITFWNHQHFTAIALYLYCYVVGSAFLPRPASPNTPRFENIYLHLCFSITLGLSFLIIGLFGVGIVGYLKVTPVLLFMALLLAVAIFFHMQSRSIPLFSYFPKNKPLFSLFQTLEFWFVCLLLLGLMILYSGVPGHADDTTYQLPHAIYYLRNGYLSINENLHYPLLAHNGILLFTWGFMFGNVILAQAMATLPVILIVLGLIGISLHLTKTTFIGMLASLIFLSSSGVAFLLGFAYVELLTASFCLSGVLALVLYLDKSATSPSSPRQQTWIILSGIFMGTALGTKLLVLPFICLSCFILCFYKQWKAAVWFLVFVFIFGSAWYIRSWLISGDPIHPFGAPWFGDFLYTAVDQQIHIDERNSLKTAYPWLSLVEAHQSYQFLVFSCLLFFRSFNRHIWSFLFIWFFTVLAWHFSSMPLDRYLTSTVPFASFLVALSINQILKFIVDKKIVDTTIHRLHQVLLCICIGGFLIYMIHIPLYMIRLSKPMEMLIYRDRLGFRGYMAANQLIKKTDETILNLFVYWGTFFFNGKVLGDWVGPVRYSDFCIEPRTLFPNRCTLIPPKEMLVKMKSLNTELLLINKRIVATPNDYLLYFVIEYQNETDLLLRVKPTN
jgi:hypothetical protein